MTTGTTFFFFILDPAADMGVRVTNHPDPDPGSIHSSTISSRSSGCFSGYVLTTTVQVRKELFEGLKGGIMWMRKS